MAQRTIDLTLSVLASAAGLFLSWPFWRDHEFFAESPNMWWLYFGVGFVLGVYVFGVFIRCTRTLFDHYAVLMQGKAPSGAAAKGSKAGEP